MTHVFLGSIFPLLLAAVVYGLYQNKRLSVIAFGLATLNPWFFQFSRLGFDALLSLSFYFAATAVVLNTKGWRKLSSLPIWFLGFFQYQGLKIVFLPMVLFLVIFEVTKLDFVQKEVWKSKLQKMAPLLVLLGLATILFGSYFLRLSARPAGSRTNDILFFNQEVVSKLVNEDRRLEFANPLRNIFTNKLTAIGQEVLAKYSQVFHPYNLFVKGEPIRNPFAVWSAGIFYLMDAPLLLLGAVIMWQNQKWRKANLLLLGWILIAPLPSAINAIDSWIMFRASFLFPLLLIVIAVGIEWCWQQPGKFWRFLKVVLIVTYTLNVIWFGYQYFFRYPLYSTKGSAFAERVLASYIHRVDPTKNLTVFAAEDHFVFDAYLVYNKLITPANLPAIHQAYQKWAFVLGNVTMKAACIDFSTLNEHSVIISESINVPCLEEGKNKPSFQPVITQIASPYDNNSIFKIYNDPLCSKYQINNFPTVANRSQLDVEKLSDQEFCQHFITRP
jgi:uncharacterized membrane protein